MRSRKALKAEIKALEHEVEQARQRADDERTTAAKARIDALAAKDSLQWAQKARRIARIVEDAGARGAIIPVAATVDSHTLSLYGPPEASLTVEFRGDPEALVALANGLLQ